MADDIKGPGNIGKWVLLIVAIIAIILTLYQLYLKTRNDENDDPPIPEPECITSAECEPDHECINGFCRPIDPGIPGTPDFWSFDETFPPSINFIYNLPEPVYLSSLSGTFHLINTCPGCWLPQRAGLRIFVHKTNGQRVSIHEIYPPFGIGDGWHSFETLPGIGDVTAIELIIDRWYMGDRALRLDAARGAMTVFV